MNAERSNSFDQVRLLGALFFIAITMESAAGEIPTDGFEISPNVKVEMNKATHDEFKRAEKALKIGEQFMQRHLDGSAYEFNEDYASWGVAYDLEDILDMSAEQWARETEKWGGGREKLNEARTGKSGWLVCPNVAIYRLQRTERGISVFYRTMFVGYLNFRASIGQPESFRDDRNGQPYEVRLDINDEWKIVRVVPYNDIVPKRFTWAYWDMSGFARNPTRVPGQSDSYVAATAAKFERLSKELEQAAQVCTK